ncbi:hypothetical protein HUJ04_010408 [Dendroctonus ponderosae]|nr:hypothetical protein HUJ04_010408 [Dendroctonus ponderosae]
MFKPTSAPADASIVHAISSTEVHGAVEICDTITFDNIFVPACETLNLQLRDKMLLFTSEGPPPLATRNGKVKNVPQRTEWAENLIIGSYSLTI